MWLWLVPLAWAALSALVTGMWIALQHVAWRRQRRHAQSCVVVQLVPKKGRRPAA